MLCERRPFAIGCLFAVEVGEHFVKLGHDSTKSHGTRQKEHDAENLGRGGRKFVRIPLNMQTPRTEGE